MHATRWRSWSACRKAASRCAGWRAASSTIPNRREKSTRSPSDAARTLATVKFAGLLVAHVVAVGVLWLAGEQHRKNCQDAGRSSCSALPWDSGM
jgi:hypothetical protein